MSGAAPAFVLTALSLGLWAQSRPASTMTCPLPPRVAASSQYPVIATALGGDGQELLGFCAVAERMRAHHRAALASWDGRDAAALQALLRQHAATEALFVVTPDVLDADLHRQVLRAATRLDDDPFGDVRFGYFVAETAQDLDALATRTIAMHAKGLSSQRWLATSW